MVNIIHRVGIRASVSDVYAAIATVEGISKWWTRETTGDSTVGGAMEVRFTDTIGNLVGSMTIGVASLEVNRRVCWQFKAGPEEWMGTEVTFDLNREGDFTIVIFSHSNWREAIEFTAHCSMKWAIFLLSLKELLETGLGSPSPDDIKIDNWN